MRQTIQEIAARHKVHTNQVSTWKRQAPAGPAEVFSNGSDHGRRDHESEGCNLHAKIGQLTVEQDFWGKGLKRWAGAGAQGDEPGRSPGPQFEPSVRAAFDQPVVVLLRAEGREV